MKVKARQKSFKQNGKEITFDEVYVNIEPVKGYPYELVLSLDPNAKQVIVKNLEQAEVITEPAQYVNDNGEYVNYTSIFVRVGVYDFKLKKRPSLAEIYLVQLANGLIKEKESK